MSTKYHNSLKSSKEAYIGLPSGHLVKVEDTKARHATVKPISSKHYMGIIRICMREDAPIVV